MQNKTTLVLTYNKVDGFKPGAYGNGRVVVLQADLAKFKDNDTEKSSFELYFQTFNLVKRNIAEAIIYLGDLKEASPNWQAKRRAFDAMYRTAIAHVKTADKVLMVTCRCDRDLKEKFAEQLRVKLIWSGCGGGRTLGRLIQERLDEVPQAPTVRELALQVEFATLAQENGWVQTPSFRNFAVLGATLFANRNDGTIFKKTESGWDENGLQIAFGANEMKENRDRKKLKILVFAGGGIDRKSAEFSLAGHELTIVGTYDEAQDALIPKTNYTEKESIYRKLSAEKGGGIRMWKREEMMAKAETLATTFPDFDVVLTDLLVPASARIQGFQQFVGQKMPLGSVIALLALTARVKNVAVVTDMNHHNPPASAAFDCFTEKQHCEGIRILCTNNVGRIRIDTETNTAVAHDFLESDASLEKYPYLRQGEEGWGERKGLTIGGKDWGKILRLVVGD